ncbi:MAG: hypothetical protein JWQ95_1660 [Sphaerisporangium sp.]|nr:hypothetical protein [Sphaerisporangium sp.]
MNTRAGATDTTARPDSVTRVLPRRPVKTYIHYGREVYADTGRPVDERLGSHVVLWIVEDAQAWAAQIEADADAAVAKYPRCRIARHTASGTTRARRRSAPPAVVAGFLTVHGAGLVGAARDYGVALVVLAVLALVGPLRSRRPAGVR